METGSNSLILPYRWEENRMPRLQSKSAESLVFHIRLIFKKKQANEFFLGGNITLAS